MSIEAVVMMVVAMTILWGGLVLAVLNLRRSDTLPTEDETHRDL